MSTGTHGSTGPFEIPNTLDSQPHWNTAVVTPSAPPMLSRFITAAWIGITNERKITNSSSAESTTTTPMKRGSFPDRTPEKSIEPAVKPPTSAVTPSRFRSGGRTVSRSR
jgi:hypothetical protein